MNEIATKERSTMGAIAISAGPNGSSIAPQSLSDVVRFAEVMCKADIALPKHLRGNAGACMAVALQALEWQMSPFAVASKSYAVNGAIAYEAQLIVAVVNTRSGIEGRLKYRFEGEGGDRVCIAFATLNGEELEVRSPKFKDITPKNSPLWKSDPDQQHCYYTGRSWARRYTPEVILGVYDREEVEQFHGAETARDVSPSLRERLAAGRAIAHDPAETREGFNRAVDLQKQEPSETPGSDVVDGSVDQGSGASPDVPHAAPALSAEEAEQTEGGNEAGAVTTEQPAPPSDLKSECSKKLLDLATDTTNFPVASDRVSAVADAAELWIEQVDKEFVTAVFTTAKKVIKNEIGREAAQRYLETV